MISGNKYAKNAGRLSISYWWSLSDEGNAATTREHYLIQLLVAVSWIEITAAITVAQFFIVQMEFCLFDILANKFTHHCLIIVEFGWSWSSPGTFLGIVPN